MFQAEELYHKYHYWSLLDRTGFAVYRARQLELDEFGITIEQLSTLFILLDHGGSMVVTDMFVETLRRPNTVYTLLDRMTRMGLVTKTKKKGDKQTVVTVTERGVHLFEQVTTKSLEMAFLPYSFEQKVELAEILKAITTRARSILGLQYEPPLIQYLHGGKIEKAPRILRSHSEDMPDTKLWALLNTGRFAVNRVWEIELIKSDITTEQLAVLHLLVHEGKALSIGEIITETMRQSASVYQLINRLKNKNLVEMVKSNHDNASTVVITEAGRELFQAVTIESLDHIFQFSNQDRERYLFLLDALNTHMREILGLALMPLSIPRT